MYQPLKMLLLVISAMQLVAIAVSEEQETNFEALLGEEDRKNEFFKRFFNLSRHVNDAQQKLQWMLERQELLSQVDELQYIMEELQQNHTLSKQSEAECREEIIQLESKLNDSKMEAVKLTVKISEMQQVNMKLDFVNQNTSKVAENLQREVVVLNLLLEGKIEETVELKMKKLELDRLNQNISKLSKDLQDEVTSLSLSLSLVVDENRGLKERAREMNDQINHFKDTISDNSNKIFQMSAESRQNEMQIQNISDINAEVMKNLEVIFRNAAVEGDVNLMEQLVTCRVNVNAGDENNLTALILAVINKRTYVVKSLIAAGANMNIRSNNNDTALIYAAYGNQTEICEMLLDAGADANIHNLDGVSAISHAALRNNLKMIEMLLKRGARVNVVDNVGDTPLHDAAKHLNIDMVKMLLENGAEANFVDASNDTPLFIVVRKGNLDVSRLFLENGAQVNLINNHGETPLHVASGYGHIDVAKILVQHGADLTIKSNNGRTPFGVALTVGRPEMINYLKSIGSTE